MAEVWDTLSNEEKWAAARATSPSLRLAELVPPLQIDGDIVDFDAYPYLPRIIDDPHPMISILKGAQLGLTVSMILKMIMRLARERSRGAIYLFPREIDAIQFSKARFARILRDNPALSTLVRDTDSAQIRRIGQGFAYFRGAASVPALKSVPADMLVFDELDEMDPDKVELARHRLDGSQKPCTLELSTPTVPDYGVDLSFKASDQHVWMIPCMDSTCGEWTCLELAWPDSLQPIRAGHRSGEWYRACRKCRKEIYPSLGEWVPIFPERTKFKGTTKPSAEDLQRAPGRRGFWVNQLNSPRRDPTQIMAEFQEADRKGKVKEFSNSVLGTAYAEIEDALSKDIVLSCCNPDMPRKPSSPGPTGFGFDCGQRDFHWAAMERMSKDRAQVVNYGVCSTEDELIDLIDRYNAGCVVGDEMAETRTVRRIKARRQGRVWGNWYQEHRRQGAQFDSKAMTVQTGRTESLDDSHRRLIHGFITLPRPDDLMHELLIPQMINLVRVVRQVSRGDAVDIGKTRAMWIVRGTKNDHLRHAFNYATIAVDRVGIISANRRSNRPLRDTNHLGWMGR